MIILSTGTGIVLKALRGVKALQWAPLSVSVFTVFWMLTKYALNCNFYCIFVKLNTIFWSSVLKVGLGVHSWCDVWCFEECVVPFGIVVMSFWMTYPVKSMFYSKTSIDIFANADHLTWNSQTWGVMWKLEASGFQRCTFWPHDLRVRTGEFLLPNSLRFTSPEKKKKPKWHRKITKHTERN